jgi:catechol 2,3-dioxygenase-like lactoylglutathione lyase family enzyme
MERPGLRFTATTLCSPDAGALARFYAGLLGWAVKKEEPGWVMLAAPDGGRELYFHGDEAYRPPVWPSRPDRQQMMSHLEIQADDVPAAVAFAESLGARQAEFQPQDDVRVMLDPDGHPFCLYRH